jgi:hypothetical protein
MAQAFQEDAMYFETSNLHMDNFRTILTRIISEVLEATLF